MGTALRALALADASAVGVDRTRVLEVLQAEVAKADASWLTWKKLGGSAEKLAERQKARDITRYVLRQAEADSLSAEDWANIDLSIVEASP